MYALLASVLFFCALFLLPQLLFAQATNADRGLLMTGLQGLLYTIVNVVFGTLAGLAGLLLNEAVGTYVVGFGELYRTSGLGWTIDNLWSTVRDIFNLTFIFGLVYIGFKMIFNSGDSSAKRMLGSLVLAALLVNFSLFITKFVIDFSNIAATQLAAGFNNAGDYAVSDGFMNLMGLSGLFSTGPSLAEMTTSRGFAFIFGSLILYIVAAFVFAAGGLLLMIRFAVLNIYMILSPLMFLGMVFPGFSSVSRDYWKGFLGRAFFAPAYILMLYFAHQILVNMRGVSAGTAQMADVFGARNPEPGFAATIPYFILTAVFMIAALVVAQKMGAQGATSALSLGKRMSSGTRKYVQRGAGAVTFGAAAKAGQRTFGSYAQTLSDKKGFQKFAAKSWVGEKALKATKVVADTSFDARQVAGFGAAAGIGTGTKGGFKSRVDAKNKADAEFAKSLGETKVEKDLRGKYVDAQIGEQVEKNLAEIRDNPKSNLNITKEIEMEAKLAKEKAAQELEDAKKNIAGERKALTDKIQKLEQDKKKTILQPEIDAIDKDLAEAKSALEKSGSAVLTLEKGFDEAAKKAKKASDQVAIANKEAIEAAESRVTFEKQLAFIQRQERGAAKWRSNGATVTGGAAGVAGAGALSTLGTLGTGGAVLAGGAAGALIVRSYGQQNQASADNLKKIYGTDGTVRKKAKNKEENLKILTEQMKDLEGAPAKAEPKADDE